VITGLLGSSDGTWNCSGATLAVCQPRADPVSPRKRRLRFPAIQFVASPDGRENAAVPLIAAGMKRTESSWRAKALLDHWDSTAA